MHEDGYSEALRRIAQEKQERSGQLDLCDLGLTLLPSELAELEDLESLLLGGTFSPHGNPLNGSGALSPLSKLTKLKELKCSDTSIIDLSPLAELQSLKWLECENTAVTDLRPLKGLKNLQEVHCSHTRVSDLSPFEKLQSLKVLICSFTDVNDLTPLAELRNLQILDCSLTKVSDLSPLARVQSLRLLCCYGCAVHNLAPLSGLQALQELDCAANAIHDLGPLAGLQSLIRLNCSDTRVSDLHPLAGLQNLYDLECQNLSLNQLPEALVLKASLELWDFSGTTVKGVPAEVVRDLEQLRNHLRDLKKAEPATFTDIKVIIIGNGYVGKTQLCRHLQGKAYDEAEPSTHGIHLSRMAFPAPIGVEQESDIACNYWDFGGQDLYHGTHALFMRTRAVFIVAWTPALENTDRYRDQQNQRLPYWLEYVYHLGGAHSPVVVVQTQCDKVSSEAIVPDNEILKQFRGMRPRTVHFSARTGYGADSLRQAILDAVGALRQNEGISHIGAGRMRVHRQLTTWQEEDRQRPEADRLHRTLSWSAFKALCDLGNGDVSSPESLLHFLHDTGRLFHDGDHFESQIILDQSWALNAIYAVFDRKPKGHRNQSLADRIRSQQGRFTLDDLAAWLWDAQGYSRADQEMFLSMMLSCGIAFILERDEELGNTYVAPELLPADQDALKVSMHGRWDEEAETVERIYRYDFLHHGLIRSLIFKIGSEAGAYGHYWKNGAFVFHEAHSGSSALVEARFTGGTKGEIHLRTQGRDPRKLNALIHKWINNVGNHCACKCTATIEPEDRPQRNVALPEKDPSYQPKMDDRRKIPNCALEIAVSYAWWDNDDDKSDSQGRVDSFCEQMLEAGIKVIRDKTHALVHHSLSEFMNRISRADRVYIFLSDRYLKSENCMYELYGAWQHVLTDHEDFRTKARVYFIKSARDIQKPIGRMKRGKFWGEKYKKLQEAIKECGHEYLSPSDKAKWDLMRHFAIETSEILSTISDSNQLRDFDNFTKDAIATEIAEIEKLRTK
ncbi:MAG: COR domain-containing protein [Verrucomicrobiota bacterium JB022]|nr:COR domain-containing protein [Verrucomicrobiota bacterium JB022]